MAATGVLIAGDRAGRQDRRRLLLVAVGLIVGLGLAGAVGWRLFWYAGPPIVEYRVPTPGSIPATIAAAPDGTVWFTLDASNELGQVRNGQLSTLPKGVKNAEPLGLAVAPDGAVWYTDALAAAVVRRGVDGSVDSIPLAVPPHQRAHPSDKLGRLVAGPDGSVWFADGTTNSITRVHAGTMTSHELPTFRAGPFGVAVAPDGTVWTTLQYVNRLARIAPDGTVTELDVPTRQGYPVDIAIGPDGAVWFAEMRANKIGRYADGRFSEYPVPTPAAGLSGLAVAPDGAVWFTETRGHKLGRLRDGAIKEFDLPRADARPFGIAVDGSGNVWYTDLSGVVGMVPAERARAR